MTPFDVTGPLPRGTTLLEASAGTGKTSTIAALTTRYVAEGVVGLSEVMLVTFGNAASRELRDRVRERLVRSELGLRDPAAARAGDDPVLRRLAAGGDARAELCRARLADALAGFDGATIATTHSFCASMLSGLGLAADSDRTATRAPLDDLLGEVVDDLFVQAYAPHGAVEPELTRDELLALGRAAVADRTARLEPQGAPGTAGRRWAAASRVREEVERRKRRAGLVDHDDALVLLRDALAHLEHGPPACARLRARFRVVLVDEFQDTDPVQWEVLRRAFGERPVSGAPSGGVEALVLLGDPKQAVYAFRGGDVHTYLAAAGTARAASTLSCNWRSDAPLLQALEQVLGGVALGHPEIVARPVDAVHHGARLRAAGPALRLRQLPRTGHGPLRQGLPAVDPVSEAVARDVAADVVELLQGPARLRPAPGAAERPVEPGDVAVLVRTHRQGQRVRDALARVGVPAVLAGGGSVFRTASATSWLVLLEALEQPHRAGRVRAAALSVFLGHDAAGLDAGGDELTDALSPRLRAGAELLAERGVAAFAEALYAQERLAARVLARPDGERVLTDLRHVAQALHAAALQDQLGLTALVEWLRRRIAQAEVEADDERTRRLETDAAAVQVMTVHVSKGLEFAVVHVPFGWDRYVPPRPAVLRLHAADGQRVLDVGGSDAPGHAEALARHRAEESGEDLRLLYVALTRARCQVVAHWAPATRTGQSPLHRVLFGPRVPGEVPPASVPVPRDDAAAARLAALADASGGCLGVERVQARPEVRWQPPEQAAPDLSVRRLTRTLDTAWRRTSYSALTAGAHELPGAASEPDAPDKDDERDEPATPGPAAAPGPAPAPSGPEQTAPPAVGPGTTETGTTETEPPPDALLSPLGALPGGTAFGLLVHEVLEDPDPGALDRRCREALARRPGSGIDPAALADGLRPVLLTPLGRLGVALADIAPRDRLAETAFELPLAGGDAPSTGHATLADVAALLRRYDLGSLAGYPDLLGQLDPAALRGFLTGSIDAVLRLPGPRYVVVDHKTNRLGGDPLTAWHYRPEALAREMLRSHYVLQALLYAVALHRYLRWRQAGYDPAVHLGPVLYLFVRGMGGPGTPPGTGVFTWQPPTGLVVALSDLLAGPR